MNKVKPAYLDIIIDTDFISEDSPHYPLIKDKTCMVDWDNNQQENGPRIRTRVDLSKGKIVDEEVCLSRLVHEVLIFFTMKI